MRDPATKGRVLTHEDLVGVKRVEVPRDAGEGHDVAFSHRPSRRGHLEPSWEILKVQRFHQSLPRTFGTPASPMSVKTIWTGMSQRRLSAGVSTTFTVKCGPSDSLTTAKTYGTSSAKAGSAVRCTTAKVWRLPFPVASTHSRSDPEQARQKGRG